MLFYRSISVLYTLLECDTGLENGEIGGAALLCGGADAARGDIDDEGGEALEEFIHGNILQQHTGIKVYPLGLAACQVAVRADLQGWNEGGEGGAATGGEQDELTAGSSEGGTGHEVVAGGGEEK